VRLQRSKSTVLIDAQWRKAVTARGVFEHIARGDAILVFNNEIELEYLHTSVKAAFEHGERIDSSNTRFTACPDPADKCFVECAIAGQADCIISEDKDLRKLRKCPVPVYRSKDMQYRFPEFRGFGLSPSSPPRRKPPRQ